MCLTGSHHFLLDIRRDRSRGMSSFFYTQIVNNFFILRVDLLVKMEYIIHMKARKTKYGFMGSASREHRVKKGKGSFKRRKKHQKKLD